MHDLVQPVGAGRDLGGAGRDAGFEGPISKRCWRMGWMIGDRRGDVAAPLEEPDLCGLGLYNRFCVKLLQPSLQLRDSGLEIVTTDRPSPREDWIG